MQDPMAFLVSPFTHAPLHREGDALVSGDGSEHFPVVRGVPVLLDEQTTADWHRELMEVILWQYPEELTKMYATIDWSHPVADIVLIYRQKIRELLGDKAGIRRAIESYIAENGEKWIVNSPQKAGNIPLTVLESFDRLSAPVVGRNRVESTRHNGEDGWALHLPYYREQVFADEPDRVVELSTGSGFGTAAIADALPVHTDMYTVDIGFNCHGNVVGIAAFLGLEGRLQSVCANFWRLPFASGSVDAVCSNFGLDESRENGRTLAETARILRPGGRFVNVSRSNAFIRQYNILEPFGFEREEALELLKRARAYSDTENLAEQCSALGLQPAGRREFEEKYCVTVFVKQPGTENR